MKVAVLFIGIGKYACFWKDFYISSDRYFLPDTLKEYYVFSDQKQVYAEEAKNVHLIYQEDMGWPLNTFLRFRFFNSIKNELENFDFIFFMNANICFNQRINEQDFLPMEEDYTFVLHHAFWNQDRGIYPYERNPESEAYIPFGAGKYYITGGINGGKAKAFLKMSEELDAAIQKDLQKGIIAIWHDESFLNKYAVKNTNYKILPPSYFYPELSGGINIGAERKIVARDKRKYFDVNSFKNIPEHSFAEDFGKKLSDNYYYRLCFRWLMLKAHHCSIVEFLKEYHHIAIYSYRNLGEVLINEMENSHCADIIACILDPEPEKYNGKYKVCKPYEFDHSIDLIVVTEAFRYSEIMPAISMFSNIPIISVEDIINLEIIKNKIPINSGLW